MRHRVRAFLSWIGRHELLTVVSVLVLTGSVWIFIELAGEVGEGDTRDTDRAILLGLRDANNTADPWGPQWFEEAIRDITALGGFVVILLVSLATVGFLLLRRKYHAGLYLTVSVTGAMVLSNLLKTGFGRERPDVVTHHAYVMTASFPSGHAMTAAAVYLTLGAFLARMQTSLVTRAYFLLWAIAITLLIGFSRVYIGVHWPTDVLAGWTAGAGWAALCWLVARALQRRGAVEQPDDLLDRTADPATS